MPPHVRCAGPWIVASALLLGAAATGSAQNPDLILSKAARDSILATYDNIFPIWGRKAIDALEPLLGGNLGNVTGQLLAPEIGRRSVEHDSRCVVGPREALAVPPRDWIHRASPGPGDVELPVQLVA